MLGSGRRETRYGAPAIPSPPAGRRRVLPRNPTPASVATNNEQSRGEGEAADAFKALRLRPPSSPPLVAGPVTLRCLKEPRLCRADDVPNPRTSETPGKNRGRAPPNESNDATPRIPARTPTSLRFFSAKPERKQSAIWDTTQREVTTPPRPPLNARRKSRKS